MESSEHLWFAKSTNAMIYTGIQRYNLCDSTNDISRDTCGDTSRFLDAVSYAWLDTLEVPARGSARSRLLKARTRSQNAAARNHFTRQLRHLSPVVREFEAAHVDSDISTWRTTKSEDGASASSSDLMRVCLHFISSIQPETATILNRE